MDITASVSANWSNIEDRVIIDPDEFPDPDSRIKAEPNDDVVFMKAEPTVGGLSRVWLSTEGTGDEPIMLDDSDDELEPVTCGSLLGSNFAASDASLPNATSQFEQVDQAGPVMGVDNGYDIIAHLSLPGNNPATSGTLFLPQALQFEQANPQIQPTDQMNIDHGQLRSRSLPSDASLTDSVMQIEQTDHMALEHDALISASLPGARDTALLLTSVNNAAQVEQVDRMDVDRTEASNDAATPMSDRSPRTTYPSDSNTLNMQLSGFQKYIASKNGGSSLYRDKIKAAQLRVKMTQASKPSPAPGPKPTPVQGQNKGAQPASEASSSGTRPSRTSAPRPTAMDLNLDVDMEPATENDRNVGNESDYDSEREHKKQVKQ
jgi:hypothetical protein